MNDSENFRRQCEARLVMTWPKARRADHYEGVKKIRGVKALDDLIEEVKKQYRMREAEVSL